jgi:hypothetical protein
VRFTRFDKTMNDDVGESPFDRDRKEYLDNSWKRISLDKAAQCQFVPDDDRRQYCEAYTRANKEAHHCHVIDLGGNLRTNTKAIDERIEPGSDTAVGEREDNGILGKQFANRSIAVDQMRNADQTYWLLGQFVGDEGGQSVACRYLIGEHDIELQGLETGEKISGATRTEDDFYIAASDHWLEKTHLKISRQCCKCADAQRLPNLTCLLECSDQLVAGRKNRVGMVEGNAACLGKMELSPPTFEQEMAEPVLKLADLHRQRGLREIQPRSGARQIAVLSDRPEIAQMVVVQVSHIVRLNGTI